MKNELEMQLLTSESLSLKYTKKRKDEQFIEFRISWEQAFYHSTVLNPAYFPSCLWLVFISARTY